MNRHGKNPAPLCIRFHFVFNPYLLSVLQNREEARKVLTIRIRSRLRAIRKSEIKSVGSGGGGGVQKKNGRKLT